jgi:DNA-binding MarR family transcriptional regulator
MSHIDDQLLDELDDAIVRMGRVMAARHAMPHCCDDALTLSQTMLLRSLDTHEGCKMSDVASLMAIKPPAASAAIAALEKDGFVERLHDESDRRVTHVHLTTGGRSALHNAETTRRETMRRYLSVLTEDDVRSLIRIHNVLLAAMDEGLA